MPDDLDDFLGSKSETQPDPPAEQTPPPETPVEPDVKSDKLDKPDKLDKTEAKPDVKAEPKPDEDEPIPDPQPGERVVPLSALTKARQDYKTRATAAETEARILREAKESMDREKADLQRQLDEARRAPPSPPTPAQPPNIPDPTTDPRGYAAFLQDQSWNDLLNRSEQAFKQAHPDVDLGKLTEGFKTEAQRNPNLAAQLRQQFHPYEWLAAQMKRLEGLKEIGEDPAAYRARVRAELEAELAAQAAAQPPAPAPRQPAPPVKLPASIANAPSAGDRAATPWVGPPDLEEILGR